MKFPDHFVWGAAAASYQIEGAAFEDGKTASVWDMFAHRPGKVFENQTGDVACDHYHRFSEDIAIMQAMDLKAYRLSLSWPRLLPDGTGALNPNGAAFYDRLVDQLLAAGIQPYVTLFHWDFPLALYHRGGWLNRDSADWFGEYAGQAVRLLSDRVSGWMTLNEPQCTVELGHRVGEHAPGDQVGLPEALRVAHHLLLGHGKAVQALRAGASQPLQVGWAPIGSVKYPLSNNPADVEAARRASFAITQPNFWGNTWFADPIFFGAYPEDGRQVYQTELEFVQPGDMETIRQPLDFYGANTYFGTPVRAGANGQPEDVPFPPGYPMNDYGWPITPEALEWGPRFLWERYGKPIFITENGMCNVDSISLDGQVHDPQRIDYTTRYLLALQRAIAAGADVRGYFHWSLMDNFEWASGYKYRFGLVYVDFATQRRVLKDSAHWYRQVIETNGGSLSA